MLYLDMLISRHLSFIHCAQESPASLCQVWNGFKHSTSTQISTHVLHAVTTYLPEQDSVH
jgi:hypothetical protein